MIRGLGTELRSLVGELDGGVQSIYDELGLEFRPRFYPIVQALLHEPCLSVGDIADRIGVTQPAATQTIGEMKKAGLIDVAAGEDRRARLAKLTDEAVRLTRELAPVWRAVDRAAHALDSQLAAPLQTVIRQAMDALHEQGFADRIRAQLRDEK